MKNGQNIFARVIGISFLVVAGVLSYAIYSLKSSRPTSNWFLYCLLGGVAIGGLLLISYSYNRLKKWRNTLGYILFLAMGAVGIIQFFTPYSNFYERTPRLILLIIGVGLVIGSSIYYLLIYRKQKSIVG